MSSLSEKGLTRTEEWFEIARHFIFAPGSRHHRDDVVREQFQILIIITAKHMKLLQDGCSESTLGLN